MMYSIQREIHFSYGHRLLHHPGKCAHLHGHNGKVVLEISSEKLNAQNMVIDFADVKKSIGQWIKENLDHRMILWEKDPVAQVLQKAGESIVLMKENPTAEAIARWIFEEARKLRLPVFRVTLWETADCAASYHA